MSYVPNVFTNMLALAEVLNNEDLYEVRTETGDCGKVLYIGKSIQADANPALRIWFIKKLEYDINGNLSRIRLPDSGAGFLYAWDDRTSYFS